MVKRLIGLLLLGLVVVLLVPTGQINSQSRREEWSSPLFLGDGWWQSITTDIQGTTHVTWYASLSKDVAGKLGRDALAYRSRDINGNWTDLLIAVFPNVTGWTVRSGLAVTTDGILHAAVRYDQAQILTNVSVALAAQSARFWSPPVEISPAGYYLSMIASRDDTLHYIYSGRNPNEPFVNLETNPCAFCNDLYYRRSTDEGKTWTTPFALSHEPNTGSDRLEIFQGGSGRIYVDWDEGYDWFAGRGTVKDVRLVISNDNGSTWSKPIIFDGGNLTERKPVQIAATELRDNSIMVVWRYSNDTDRNIYFQMSDDVGATWTDPQPIPGILARSMNDTPLDDYNLITDKFGVVHLFAVGQLGDPNKSNATLYHATYQQGIWTRPFPIFYSPDYQPEWPKATIGPQNDIHLVWFLRGIKEGVPIELQSYTDILKVYYSHLPGSLSVLPTPTFRPIATELPTPTVVQHFVPTLTAYPTFDNVNVNYFTSSSDTYAANVIVGGFLAVGLFCSGVLIYMRFFRR